jgi:hypothetical protein
MSRLLMVRPLLLAALGAALVLAPAAAAQAGVPAHAGVAAHQAVAVARYQLTTGWQFYGFTYQDSPTGLADCNARGKLLVRGSITAYRCILGSPNLGLYNLWVDVS